LTNDSEQFIIVIIIYYIRLTTFFQDSLGNLAPGTSTMLDFNEARDDGVVVASAGPYVNHLHLAPDR